MQASPETENPHRAVAERTGNAERAEAAAGGSPDENNRPDAERAYLESANLGGAAAGDDDGPSPGADGRGGGGGRRARSRKRAPRRLFPGGRMPTMEEFCDMVVEALFV